MGIVKGAAMTEKTSEVLVRSAPTRVLAKSNGKESLTKHEFIFPEESCSLGGKLDKSG